MRGPRQIENREHSLGRSDAPNPIDNRHSPEDYVWATGDQARLRAFSLWIIRSIVEKHGGVIEIDLATDTINIDVPAEEQAACALEIEEQMGAMCY